MFDLVQVFNVDLLRTMMAHMYTFRNDKGLRIMYLEFFGTLIKQSKRVMIERLFEAGYTPFALTVL